MLKRDYPPLFRNGYWLLKYILALGNKQLMLAKEGYQDL